MNAEWPVPPEPKLRMTLDTKVIVWTRQRWNADATNGHGGNVELRGLDPASFRFSLLRVFDPATPTKDIDAAASHFKDAFDTRRHGLNRN